MGSALLGDNLDNWILDIYLLATYITFQITNKCKRK